MFADYVETIRLLFRDTAGVDISEASFDCLRAYEEVRRAYEEGASEQEACDRLLELVANNQ